MTPTAAAVGDGAATNYAAVAVSAGHGFLLVIAAEGIALARGVAHQTVVVAEIELQPLVFVVFVLAAVLAPASLLQHDHRKTGNRQLFGHDAAAGAGSDDDEVDFSGCRIFFHDGAPSRLSGRQGLLIVKAEW